MTMGIVNAGAMPIYEDIEQVPASSLPTLIQRRTAASPQHPMRSPLHVLTRVLPSRANPH